MPTRNSDNESRQHTSIAIRNFFTGMASYLESKNMTSGCYVTAIIVQELCHGKICFIPILSATNLILIDCDAHARHNMYSA